jgi:hypothetical protein
VVFVLSAHIAGRSARSRGPRRTPVRVWLVKDIHLDRVPRYEDGHQVIVA